MTFPLPGDAFSPAFPDCHDPLEDCASAEGAGAAARLAAPVAGWLQALTCPDSWVDTQDPARHADFLFMLATAAHDAGAFPPGTRLLVSWVRLNRLGSSEVRSLELPDALPNRAASGPSPAGPRPWLSVYIEYDGEVQLGCGAVVPGQDGPEPVMARHVAMSPAAVGDMLADLGRTGHRARGAASGHDFHDGRALRDAIARHLMARPERAKALASDFPLATGFRAPCVSREIAAVAHRARHDQLRRDAGVVDNLVPAETMRALLDPASSGVVRDRRGISALARRLKISPSALRRSICIDGRLTVLGRQNLLPGLVRHPWSPDAAQRFGALHYSTVAGLRDIFRAGFSLAEAIATRTVDASKMEAAYWIPTEEDPG